MGERLRVGVVGCGGRGRVHLSLLREFPDVETAAVCDVRREVVEAAGAEFGAAGRHTELDAMLDQAGLDAVIVATSVVQNAPAAQRCLEAGLPTLLEKPPGMSVAETTALR